MRGEYRFCIEGSYTPKTLPMERLAAYVTELAKLLGERESVHFRGVEEGSAVLVADIDDPAQPKVFDRVVSLKNRRALTEVQKAFVELDNMLREDNATGTLADDASAVVIPFPGRHRPAPIVYGPFRQDGTVDGQLIRIGGRDETVPAHLRDGQLIHTGLICTPEIAQQLARHLFGSTLRVHGTGTWFRNEYGAWELRRFKISTFEILDDAPLITIVEKLRGVEGSGWREVPDPVLALLEGRHRDEDPH